MTAPLVHLVDGPDSWRNWCDATYNDGELNLEVGHTTCRACLQAMRQHHQQIAGEAQARLDYLDFGVEEDDR